MHHLNSFIVSVILPSPCLWGGGGGQEVRMRRRRKRKSDVASWSGVTLCWDDYCAIRAACLQTPEQNWCSSPSVNFWSEPTCCTSAGDVQTNCHPASCWASGFVFACGRCHVRYRKTATAKKTKNKTEQKNGFLLINKVDYIMHVKLPVLLHSTSRRAFKVRAPKEL